MACLAQLQEAIRQLDWLRAIDDVKRFLPPREQETLTLWNTDFFLYHANLLGRGLRA
jgi:hypothetical protein